MLDEPTASLDRASEAHVIDALAKLKQARTLVILTHRLDLLALADRILVLEHGQVRAMGTLDELRATHPALFNASSRFSEGKVLNRAEDTAEDKYV